MRLLAYLLTAFAHGVHAALGQRRNLLAGAMDQRRGLAAQVFHTLGEIVQRSVGLACDRLDGILGRCGSLVG